MNSVGITEGGFESSHYIVGIGASAGGLEAIEEVFNSMPSNTGMAFVIIQHLSPDYKSLMVELLSKRTKMEVLRAEEGMLVEPNKIYLIPPKNNLTIFHGKLLLSEHDNHRVPNFPIDIFLESLAEDQGNKAIGIILSGTGSDGMRGIKAIKEKGGMVMVQREDSAKFDGMPKSAISTGIVDYVLTTREMPEQLISFIEHPYASNPAETNVLLSDQKSMGKLFSLLRKKHKVDFTHYKMNTVVRRVERRMVVNHISEFRDYVGYLENNPQEITNLYKELLIGVTHFFRDKDAFDYIAQKSIIDIINKSGEKEIRIWVAGCSTGEEAYSLAIILKETMEMIGKHIYVKIFATDVDEDAILKAASGRYPEAIVSDVNPERLHKYFIATDNEFRISKEIREMIVFAKHDVLMDPPFPNIDLISCRNLLIYLQPVLQSRVLELFNYSLKPGGILFLGPSETTGDMSDNFEPMNHKWKIYRSRGKAKTLDIQKIRNITMDVSRAKNEYVPQTRTWKQTQDEKLLERIMDTIQDEYLPVTIIANESMEIVYTIGDTEGYFKVPSGKMVFTISRMASNDLSIPITTGLQKVFNTKEEVRYKNVKASIKGEKKKLDIEIKLLPSRNNQTPLAAIILKENIIPVQDQNPDQNEYDMEEIVEQRISDLEQELQFTRENLQATIEELETSNEELQATNEELFASNEELQATNEELQSVNEELHTVNSEFQAKIIELTELNQDMENLMANTQIGTLFLDENLEIRKYTTMIEKIFHLVDNDIGRPLEGIANKVVDIDLITIIKDVHENNRSYENEVHTKDDRWYFLKVLPYFISNDKYSGIVLTVIDITTLKKTQRTLEKKEMWQEEAASIAKVGGWEIDTSTMKTIWTEEVYRIHEVEPDFDHDVHNGIDFYHPDDRPIIENAVKNALEKGNPFDLKLRLITNKGKIKWVRAIGKAEKNENKIVRVYGAFQDITEQSNMISELENARNKYDVLYEMITSPAIVCNCESTGKCDIKEINCAAENIFSVKRENVVGNKLFELLPDKDGTLEELILSVKKNGLPSHIDSYTFDVENTNGKYEIYMYMLPNGEIVIIFYSID
ncbi:methylase of chemotaxis methyl-accepting protein [Methanolobus tindarius DSM 2278]|uniref:Methylase of chemotaxis methyl-accepting protein n=1 Tax=Methanolobus tindarius DSM 2278 TaxID=1090322 RepID=W9DYR3_METTI|nr:chemotaxis protein CheB [Methanolobus tindarius]ETA68852.1 methylase of chemotaxis methyl-accepting protein [Methanolobus tindarius DSM 2278]